MKSNEGHALFCRLVSFFLTDRFKNSHLKNFFKIIHAGFFLFALTSFFCFAGFANNVSVSNVEIKDDDQAEDTAVVEFDLSWEHSWKDSMNNDAVWLFVKYSSDSGSTWNHATMKSSGTNPSGFSFGTRASGAFTALDMIVPPDKKGLFIQPAHLGSGTVSFQNLQIVWNYGADGQNDPYATFSSLNGNFQVKVFAIEMVYIPTEGFYAGDGTSAGGQFKFGGNISKPAPVNSESGISFGNSASQWYYKVAGAGGDDMSDGAQFEVVEAFPKGYHAFYLMKYEITQGQYTSFLNSLLRSMQNRRVVSDITADAPVGGATYVMENSSGPNYRNTIQCPGSGNGTTSKITFTVDRPDRAMNVMGWHDFAAYTDWAGLRPITELEFEKAARGPLYPTNNEYAWGTTSISPCSTISGTEDGTEYCGDGDGFQVAYNGVSYSGGDGGSGPVRAGFFAGTPNRTARLYSGAGYYGNMELSGNLMEAAVTLGHADGRSFSGTHGDGLLTQSGTGYPGNATNSDWPGFAESNSVAGVDSSNAPYGSGYRGGDYGEGTTYLETSNRHYAAYGPSMGRHPYVGGRCARTSPED